MPLEVILPRVDMDMTTGKIAKWFVEPGARVTKGQPLFEIETDKAAMEIEAPASGTIRDLASASATDIPVGSVVAWIFGEGETAGSTHPTAAPAGKADSIAVPQQTEKRASPGDTGADRQAESSPAVNERPRATPMARRLARTHGLDVMALTGSGPRGRIQAADIAAAAKHKADPLPTAPGTMPAVPSPPAAPRSSGPLNLVRLREGEGRPMLLLHGFGADVGNWRPFLAARSSARPVLALDLPGHGASPLGAVTDFTGLVEAVERALGESGLGAIDLVGHSLGGAVAAALASRGALDVKALLLLSPAGLGPEINGSFVRGFLGATSESSLTPWMHELVADATAITPAFVRATLKAREGSGLVASQRSIADAVFPDDTQAFSIRPDLARLVIPTRIVFGTADKIIPARHATGLPGLVALHLFPGVGHLPHLERKDDVARLATQMFG